MMIAEDLQYFRIFWDDGSVGRRDPRFRNATTKPPVTGWANVFVLEGEKFDTIFCPYSFEAVQAPKGCYELSKPKEPSEWRSSWWQEHLQRKWDYFQRTGTQVSYDIASLVFRKLGMLVPVAKLTAEGGENTKAKGGKPEAEELTKPIKRKGKRGLVLDWFLKEEGGRKSIHLAMADLDMTRSNVLSHLFMLNKDHGVGYRLVGESAEVVLPVFHEGSPFDEE